jgi:hypothetical protein
MSRKLSAEQLAYLRKIPVRYSRLRHFARSGAHYAEGEWDETGPMRKGTGVHAYLLGQRQRIAVYTDGKRDERSAKYQAFKAANQGKDILIPSEVEAVEGMAEAVKAHPVARDLICGVQEQPIKWQFAGRDCLSTPDNVQLFADHKVLVELKACHTSQPDRFMKHARWMYYHAQLAFYAEALARTMQYAPTPVTERYIIAVEMEAPHCVTVIRHTDSMLQAGERAWRKWFEALRVCEESGYFPGYTDGIVDWVDETAVEDPLDWEDGEAAE